MILFEGVILDELDCENLKKSVIQYRQSGFKSGNDKMGYNLKIRNSLEGPTEIIKDSIIYNKLSKALNSFGYEFIADKFEFCLYKYGVGNFIKKHSDTDIWDRSRICVMVGLLSDNDEYEGGDFNYYDSNGKLDGILNRKMGNVVIISPETLHEVTEVTKGERNSFVITIYQSEIKSISKKSII